MDVIAEADAITGSLRALAPRRTDPSPIIKTSLPFYGAPVSAMRRIARDWHRTNAGATADGVMSLADALWARAIREEMVTAAFLVGHTPRARSGLGIRRLDRWGKRLDNWETTDQLGQAAVGRWVADDPAARFRVVETLAARRNAWLRRLSLVAAVRVLQGGGGSMWGRIEAVVLGLAGDKEAGIPKALSWVLRTGIHDCRGQVEGLLDREAANLPAIALREVRRKLATGRKAGRWTGRAPTGPF